MVVMAEPAVRSLSGLKPHYKGRNGDRGSGGYRLGASGKTAIIKVYHYCTVSCPSSNVHQIMDLVFNTAFLTFKS